jgi:hypothetical protein
LARTAKHSRARPALSPNFERQPAPTRRSLAKVGSLATKPTPVSDVRLATFRKVKTDRSADLAHPAQRGRRSSGTGVGYEPLASSSPTVATPRGRLDPNAWRSAPDLEPNEGEQDERYDERTDRVLASDVSGARLEPRKNEGRLPTGTNQYVAAMARNRTPRSPAIRGRGRFIGRMYARAANFPLRRGYVR